MSVAGDAGLSRKHPSGTAPGADMNNKRLFILALATFGLARKLWQADLRIQMQILYDGEGVVVAHYSIERMAK